MLLTVDVGNTNTVLGLFDDDHLFESYRIKTDARVTADELAPAWAGAGIAREASDDVGERIRVTGSREPGIGHEFGQSSDARGGDGKAGVHRLGRREAERFGRQRRDDRDRGPRAEPIKFGR